MVEIAQMESSDVDFVRDLSTGDNNKSISAITMYSLMECTASEASIGTRTKPKRPSTVPVIVGMYAGHPYTKMPENVRLLTKSNVPYKDMRLKSWKSFLNEYFATVVFLFS